MVACSMWFVVCCVIDACWRLMMVAGVSWLRCAACCVLPIGCVLLVACCSLVPYVVRCLLCVACYLLVRASCLVFVVCCL